MNRTHRTSHLFTPLTYRLIGFALVATLALGAGLAFTGSIARLAPFGHRTIAPSSAGVAPARDNSPIRSAGSSAYTGLPSAHHALTEQPEPNFGSVPHG
jgi:hypothetical protein